MDEDDENLNGQEGGKQEESNQSNVVQDAAKDQIKKQSSKKIKEQAMKEAAKTSAKLASKSSLLAALGPILIWVVIIVVAIIILVGIIMFFMTVPGMVLQQLKDFASGLMKSIGSFYGMDETHMISDDKKYEVLDYLEQMGYDLKGYGFITKDADKEDANYDENAGVIRDPDTGLISEAYSDFITTYLISDKYVYTVKNFNPTGLLGFFKNTLANLIPFGEFLFDTFFDSGDWGEGLLRIVFEDGRDYEKNLIDQIFGTNTSWTNIKVDLDSKKMGIRRGWGANYYEYNMDGWTGRYGMPLEFLLSVHLATMKPDLAYDMATGFKTDVLIKLRNITDAEVEAAYLAESGTYIKFSQFSKALTGNEAREWWEKALNWFDNAVVNTKEAQNVFDLGFEHVHTTDNPCEFDEDGNLTELSSLCKSHIKEVLEALKEVNNYSFKTYVPYLSRVTDHWYRDVYWELSADEVSSLELIKTDIEYEKKTNERWTLYETYDSGERAGEYKLYIYDSSKEGGYGDLFDGTQEEANEQEIAVVKKPVHTTIDTLISDGILGEDSKKEDGSWSAYKIEDTESGNYQRVNPDAEEGTIESKIYYKETMKKNIVQKEDGVRGVTNAEIKKMFLENKYFSYDGTAKTADIIKQVREKIGMTGKNKYGEVPTDKLDKKLKSDLGITIDEEENADLERTVGDLTSTVSITQDSLAAFSMLENTHTLDADYIYKDFKELIVELGYFTKEELSEGTPRLLQWLIPDIGSAGFPKRALDKKENELGTLLHSKQDYEANKQNTLSELAKKVGPEKTDMEGEEIEVAPSVNGISQTNIQNNVSSLSSLNSSINLTNIGKIADGAKSTSQVSVDEFIAKTREMCEYINQEGYDYCVYATCDGNGEQECVHEVHGNDKCSINGHNGSVCFLPGTFADSQESTSKHNVCCATLISWALQNVGVMPESQCIHGASNLIEWIGNNLDVQEIEVGEPLQPGDILCYTGHIDMVGEKLSDGFVKYNGGHYVSKGEVEFGPTSCIQKISGWPGGNIQKALRINWGNAGGTYEGYLGDEAVVSPVTGILLDYGTYEDGDIDAYGNEYRTNSDQKDKIDKVGYASILVLNEEISDQLVTCNKHEGEKGQGIVTVSEPQDTDALDKLSDEQKAIYGYSLFNEDYENAGIGGYIIYIDGFKCELPGEGIEEDEEGNLPEDYVPGSGQELSMEYFKQQAANGDFNECKYEETLYEKDPVYKLISEKLEEKQKARAEAKNIAAPLYKFNGSLDGENGELLVIKEGTVILITLTDKVVVVVYRGETYEPPKEPDEGEEDTRKVQGNYLRIIMRDLDDTVVENVEDYMKLDEVQDSVVADDVIKFMAGVLTAECGPTSEEGQVAAAWVIKNRLDKGTFGASLAEILVAPLQFVVVATSPEECTGGYVTQGETISLEVNGTMYYVNAPSEQAIKVAQSVMSGNSEYANPIADRCYWKSAGTNVDSSKDPIQIPPGTGNKFHY